MGADRSFAAGAEEVGATAHHPDAPGCQRLLYLLTTGCQWRLLPKEFPPFSTVQRFFYRWRDAGLWQTINHFPAMRTREATGREASPTAGVLDSQSVKTTEAAGPLGYDAGKKIKGRKRHVLTDTNGLLVAAVVHQADIQDRDGGPLVLASARYLYPWLRHVFADGAYSGAKLDTALEKNRPMDDRDHQALRCRLGIRRSATALGCRAHLCLAQS
jgi:transposase